MLSQLGHGGDGESRVASADGKFARMISASAGAGTRMARWFAGVICEAVG